MSNSLFLIIKHSKLIKYKCLKIIQLLQIFFIVFLLLHLTSINKFLKCNYLFHIIILCSQPFISSNNFNSELFSFLNHCKLSFYNSSVLFQIAECFDGSARTEIIQVENFLNRAQLAALVFLYERHIAYL